MNQLQLRIKFLKNELDALFLALIVTLVFYGFLWFLFSIVLGNPAHRYYLLLGGRWPDGIIQFFTFAAFFWATLILGAKSRRLKWENNAMSLSLLPEDEHKVLLPDRINDLRLKLYDEDEWSDSILVKTLKMACTKFRANKSVQETMDVVKIQTEINLNYLENSFGVIRYLAWSIPSIGFIGTVLGISGALSHVDEAAAGDLSSVTVALGTAFDTTLVALFLSIILMYRIHRIQQIEENFIILIQDYLMNNFINRIYVPKADRH